MTVTASARHGLQPPEAAELLRWFSGHGFTTHLPGGAELPHVLVLSRISGAYVDIAHVRCVDRTEVARLPNDEHANIWYPRHVSWHYYGSLVDALGALRRLLNRVGNRGPRGTYRPPRDGTPRPLTVTDAERATLTVRSPLADPCMDWAPR